MTKNSYSKTAIRARMEETGEPYSVAARALKREVELIDPFDGAKADFGELVLFIERLSVFIREGYTFMQSAKFVAPYTEDPVLREGLEYLESQAQCKSVAAAMEERPNAFRGIFPEILKANVELINAMGAVAKLYRVELEMEQRRLHSLKL